MCQHSIEEIKIVAKFQFLWLQYIIHYLIFVRKLLHLLFFPRYRGITAGYHSTHSLKNLSTTLRIRVLSTFFEGMKAS